MPRMLRLVVLLALIATPVAADDLEARAQKLEQRLMSPCCMANTVAVHESGASDRVRLEIRQMLGKGMSDEQILDHYVEQYGPQILSMPEAKGFNLTPYLFPLAFVILVGAAMAVAMRRWRRSAAAEPAPSAPAVADGPYTERLERELKEYE